MQALSKTCGRWRLHRSPPILEGPREAPVYSPERVDAGAVRARLDDERAGMVGAGDRAGGTRPPSSQAKPDRSGVRYRADEWTDRGVVAQLGEHLHGMQGVGGSSPPSSTNLGQVMVVPRRSPLRPDGRGGVVLPGEGERK